MRLKRDIKKHLNLTPKISSASLGVLDVLVDGKTIFSHQGEQRWPARGEIVELIRALKH